jgi:hypothetical protein
MITHFLLSFLFVVALLTLLKDAVKSGVAVEQLPAIYEQEKKAKMPAAKPLGKSADQDSKEQPANIRKTPNQKAGKSFSTPKDPTRT